MNKRCHWYDLDGVKQYLLMWNNASKDLKKKLEEEESHISSDVLFEMTGKNLINICKYGFLT